MCCIPSLYLVLMMATFGRQMAAPHAARRRLNAAITGELLELSECTEMKSNALHISPNFTQLRGPDGDVSLASASFDVSRPLKTISKGNIRFDYCSQGVTSTCENFSNWKMGRDGCQLWTNKLTIWHKFVDAIHPRYECPFQVGHYTITNMSLDAKLLEAVPFRVEDKDWKVTVNAFDEREEHWTCFHVTVKLYRTGRRG